jgi:cysteamine dioxygenase
MFSPQQLGNETQQPSELMMPHGRRELLSLSLMSFLRLGIALPAIAQSARRANQWNGFGSRTLNWDAFLETLARAATAQGPLNQDYYVEKVARLARVLNLSDPSLVRAYLSGSRQRGLHPQFADLERRTAFQITLITFERGQSLPLHDHPRMTGVMTCAAGEIDVRSFHLLEADHRSGAFVLQDEGAVRMTQGMVATLTAVSHNIHGLKAESFAQVIDIFTPPYYYCVIK